MGADLFFSDDVCVGNLKETNIKDKSWISSVYIPGIFIYTVHVFYNFKIIDLVNV